MPSVPMALVIAILGGLAGAISTHFLGRIDSIDRLGGLRRWVEETFVPRKEMDSEFKRLLEMIETVDERRQEQHEANQQNSKEALAMLREISAKLQHPPPERHAR